MRNRLHDLVLQTLEHERDDAALRRTALQHAAVEQLAALELDLRASERRVEMLEEVAAVIGLDPRLVLAAAPRA